MTHLLDRDRFVLFGLLVLGVLMVMAGLLSGRSTFQYALDDDARDAARAWVEALVARAPSDRRPELPDGHVSRLTHVATLTADGATVTVTEPSEAGELARLRADPRFPDAVAEAVRSHEPQLLRLPSTGDGARHPAAFLLAAAPGEGEPARVVVLAADQSAVEAIAGGALAAVSLMTSLLIVMGFVVPAAIAARRIRERWLAEDQMRFLALHDGLTGLPNRMHLRNRLDEAAARARRHGRLMAVLCLDLDRFKEINDSLGHATGDALLEEVSNRLRRCVRETDVIGRLGGDEFAIVAEDLESPDDARRLAGRVCQAIAEPYAVNGCEFVNSVSIGVAMGPVHGVEPGALLKNADLALYRAKHDGRNTFRFFEPEMDAALQERRRLERDLRLAIANGEMEVRYQPQYDLQTGRLTGYEALSRWRHPVRGEVPASVFLPLAEETGQMAPLGEWLLRSACAYAAGWPDHVSLAVNLSPAQFKSQDVVSVVERVLRETGFPPQRLELEITESVLLQNTDAVIDTLKRLDGLGVRIAMDDFGTGYSSLSYLTRFPVRKIKIDRSFIDTLGADSETTAIVSSIVGLGQSLNVTIAAEGVATPDQAELLRQWGCDQVQGFFHGGADGGLVTFPATDGETDKQPSQACQKPRQVA